VVCPIAEGGTPKQHAVLSKRFRCALGEGELSTHIAPSKEQSGRLQYK